MKKEKEVKVIFISSKPVQFVVDLRLILTLSQKLFQYILN